MKSSPALSVIIPAYNEALRIGPTLRAVTAWLAQQAFNSEIIVVDDGSEDDTCRVVRAEAPSAWLVKNRPNRGKGHAVRTGMLHARGDVRLFMDADNSTSIEELTKLLVHMRSGADVVIGSRRAAGASAGQKQPLYRRIWSRVANRVVQAGLLEGIADTQCGFKVFSRRAAQAIFARAETDGWGFDLEALALARLLGYRVDEVAVTWTDDERSRIHPLRDAWRITREFLRIRRSFRRARERGACVQ